MPGSADCGVILDRLMSDRGSDCSGNWDEPQHAECRDHDSQNANGSKAHRAKQSTVVSTSVDFIWPSHGRMTGYSKLIGTYSGVVGAMIVNCWLTLSVVLTKPQAETPAEGMISTRTASSLLLYDSGSAISANEG